MTIKTPVSMKNVTFGYGCHPVLDNVSLQVRAGESIGVTGPNGSGKSTLIKLILGQLKPYLGEIALFGIDLGAFRDFGRIGYVSQKATSFNAGFPTTVEEVVSAGRITGRNIFRPLNREDRYLALRALEEVGMDRHTGRLLNSLSGGQQQRVFIARALARKPDLLLLDEPTNGLDRDAQKQFYNLLKQLISNKGLTAIIVSHELDEISPVVTRLVCLDRKLCTCSCHDTEKPDPPFKCSRRLWTA